MDEQVMVSVICLVYNHEKYLRKCLDGFVMQKTNFRFEVIVHDDASTDRSADIIREYETKYPDIIRPIYQTENQWSKIADANPAQKIQSTFMYPLARGKYAAICDGDDFWCDENKLQTQLDVMESHPDCRFCVHKVQRVHESGRPLDKFCPPAQTSVDEGLIPTERYFEIIGTTYSFQTSSYFRRTEDLKKFDQDPPEYAKASDAGDEAALLYWPLLGNVYYIDRVMSCYRECSEGSWTARRKENIQAQLPHELAMMKMYDIFNECTGHKYEKLLEPRRKKYYLKSCLIQIDSGDNARILCQRENWDFMAPRSRGYKLYVILKAYAPLVANLYDRIKGK